MRAARIFPVDWMYVNSTSAIICERRTDQTNIDLNDMLENIRLLLEYIRKSKQIQGKKKVSARARQQARFVMTSRLEEISCMIK